jgi:hypothetical protein
MNTQQLNGKKSQTSEKKMNIEMIDVKLKLSSQLNIIENFNNYNLSGNSIRYVHIPRNVDIKETVKVILIFIIFYNY